MLLARQIGLADVGRTHIRKRLAQRNTQRSACISCRFGAAAALINRRRGLHRHLHRRIAHSSMTCLPRQKRNQREGKKAKKAVLHCHQVTRVFGQFNAIVTGNASRRTSCPTPSPCASEACCMPGLRLDENPGNIASPALPGGRDVSVGRR